MYTLCLSTKLLNLIGILAIASSSVEVAAESDELDDSLKQALFLVELLKSDFAEILRSNAKNNVSTIATSYEDVNSTCPMPLEDFNNSSMPMSETEVTVSGVSSTDVDSTPTASPPAPPSLTSPTPSNLVTPVLAPRMLFSSWPPMPIPAYAMPPGIGRQGNFPDENYRFPYRFNRRRMMPDYYYFDPPGKSYGNFRRLNSNDTNGPTGDLGNATATSKLQITTNIISSATSEAPTLHVEETMTTTTSLSTTIAQPSTSYLPTTEPSTSYLSTTEPSTSYLPTTEQSISPTTKQSDPPTTERSVQPTTEQSILPTTEQSILPTTEQFILSTAETEQSDQPTTERSVQPTTEQFIIPKTGQSTLLTKPRNKVGVRTRVPVLKAMAATISNRNEHHLSNVSRHHLRLKKTTTEKSTTIEDVEISQVASELEKELEGTKTENISNISSQVKLNRRKKKHSTTMKIFLKGSSRLPIPLPENNAFCHYHPNNALCGTNL